MPEFSPLDKIITQQLMAWVARRGLALLTVAAPGYQAMSAQTHWPVIEHPVVGKREAERKHSFHGISAWWRADGMLESHSPLLLFVLEGNADVRCSDYVMRVPAGNAVLIPAGIPRADGRVDVAQLLGDDPQRFSNNILFHECRGGVEVWMNYDRGNVHSRSAPNEMMIVSSSKALRALSDLEEELTQQRQNYQPLALGALEAFFLNLQRAISEQNVYYRGKIDSWEEVGSKEYDPIREAQKYIRENLHERLTLEKVAQKVRLSRTQFVKKFRQETGETFNGFVTRCRLEKARELLVSSDYPMQFIRKSLGLGSEVQFYRVFQKYENCSPTAYRKANKNSPIGNPPG